MTVEFTPWPKIQRTDKNHVIFTEKIDGTNAAIGVRFIPDSIGGISPAEPFEKPIPTEGGWNVMRCQSRKRYITPDQDNAGFARWAWDHAELLVPFLGEGLHFGEWWGQGIQRGYGMDRKIFSLFNATRWAEPMLEADDMRAIGVDVVPVLGAWDGNDFGAGLRQALRQLEAKDGKPISPAAAWYAVIYDRPEGVMSYWTAFNSYLKHVIDK